MEKCDVKDTVLMEKEKDTEFNVYRVEGEALAAVFDCGMVGDSFLRDADFLILNRCSPDRIEALERMLEIAPDITVVGTNVTLNFTEALLGRTLVKRVISDGSSIDLGGVTLRFIVVPNVNRSRRQNRSWRKEYRFLQMPNWQWIDSICTWIPERGALITGQTFSEKEGSRRKLFIEDMAPFRRHMGKFLEKLKEYGEATAYPERGERIEAKTAIAQYQGWLAELDREGKEKLAAVVYSSEFGYTKQLAERAAQGAAKVQGVEVVIMEAKAALHDWEWLPAADGIIFGVPTREGDSHRDIRRLMAEISASAAGGKLGMALGSFSYEPAGVTNTIQRMEQMGMRVVKKGLSVRFRPDEDDLKQAEKLGHYFGRCIAEDELLPFMESGENQSELPERVATDRKFLIIGNGAAGVTAAEELRKRDSACGIEIVGEEPYFGYNRQMLTKGMLHEIPEDNMFLHTRQWYGERDIDITIGVKAERIDKAAKKVFLSDGTTRSYDKLIIATGAKAAIPEIEGIGLNGVFHIRSAEETESMRRYIESHDIRDIFIIGGGILGLETAAEFDAAGFNVTISDRAPWLMEKQLDRRGGELLGRRFDAAGIRLILSAGTLKILGDDHVNGVLMETGQTVDAQLVVLCTGIRGNDRLLSHGGSITVNEKMETDVPDIYACGDCTSFQGRNCGLWIQAVEMAKVAAASAAGKQACYKEVIPAVTFAGMGVTLFAIGDTGKETGASYGIKEMDVPDEGIYKKLFFRDGKCCGGILMGDVDMAQELVEACETGSRTEDMML